MLERVHKLFVISKFSKDSWLFFEDGGVRLDRVTFLELLGEGMVGD